MKIWELFAGLDRAYGTYQVTGKDGEKLSGKGLTVQKPVNQDIWDLHLSGEPDDPPPPCHQRAHRSHRGGCAAPLSREVGWSPVAVSAGFRRVGGGDESRGGEVRRERRRPRALRLHSSGATLRPMSES